MRTQLILSLLILIIGMISGIMLYPLVFLEEKESLIMESAFLGLSFNEMSYKEFWATGYSIGFPYNTVTYDGSPVINKGFMNIGGIEIFTIASDPRILPIGSIVYIEELGLGMVTDTGRLISGNKIDVCFSSIDKAIDYGKNKVKVYLLKRGL